ncbi:sensor domain-containing diguanylate cyclase [Vibrio diazotrophicus]|uniref:sensor domain-containing diguanylate cyclase n=1 Tax=Vibrio diazotrophicus TaxID=685 RepID=UPI000C9E97DB|nr:sensor domain-containing diguanylate cyclase [Vibrio diazotrophicus]PNH77786.1 diguanylate cyclase [Vibrio diazotrophicus]
MFVTSLNLRKLILLLCIFSVAVTLVNAFYSLYIVQRSLILKNTLESNWIYADKMADITEDFIDSSMSQLSYSASLLSEKIHDYKALDHEVERLDLQTNSFDSVVIVNSDAQIVAASSNSPEIKGTKLFREDQLQSYSAKAPLVTDPFVSPNGYYIVSISHPIHSKDGDYLGFISGTIFLEQLNKLTDLLGDHIYNDGSYIYVIDRNQKIIYHPETIKIGQATSNEAITEVIKGKNGYREVKNELGNEMLVGYAPVENSNWGIVVQKSKKLVIANLNDQVFHVFLKGTPIGILTLLLIWICSIFIARPLWQLASIVKNNDNYSLINADLNKIKPWYFEVMYLKLSFLSAIGNASNTIDKLQIDIMTDPMTKVLNRRGMESVISRLNKSKVDFSVLALDIDSFKLVNDSFGHDAGDDVLKSVAKIVRESARLHDIICRSGGEEFLIFLLKTDMRAACEVAERIRLSIESNKFRKVGNLTISIGVSSCKENFRTVEDVIKSADIALYKAKRNGKNRIETYSS